jgi:hypothetical protein
MINAVEIRAMMRAEAALPPIVSDEQRARMAAYDKALEALAKKDSEVPLKLEAILKALKPPPAANVFEANEKKEGFIDLPLAAGVERALELHTAALENFRKKPPAESIAVEKLKSNGTISRVDGNKVFLKAGGLEVSVDISSIPQQVIYKALAIDESKLAGQVDRAAWLLGLGQFDEMQQVLKKIKPENRPPWVAGFEEQNTLQRLVKFETQLNSANQFLIHGKADTAQIILNNLKKDSADLIEANKDRVAALAKKLEAAGVKK